MNVHRSSDERVTLRSGVIACLLAALVGVAGCGGSEPLGGPPAPTPHVSAGDASRERRAVRIVADADGVGDVSAVVVLQDVAGFAEWWNELGFPAPVPPYDPDHEVMIGFTATYPSGCWYGLRDIEIDDAAMTIEARYLPSEPSDVCGADENPFTVVAAIGRDGLAVGEWTAQMSVTDAAASFHVR